MTGIPDLRLQGDGDIFGKLLGWNYSIPLASLSTPTPPLGPASIASKAVPNTLGKQSDSVPTVRTHLQEAPAISSTPSLSTPNNASFPKLPSGHTDLYENVSAPLQTSPEPQKSAAPSPTAASVTSKATRSPFGHGVRLPSSPRLRRRKSFGEIALVQTPEMQASNATPISIPVRDNSDVLMPSDGNLSPSDGENEYSRPLREVASTETIRNSAQGRSNEQKLDIFKPVQDASEEHVQDKGLVAVEEERPEKANFSVQFFDAFHMLDNADNKISIDNMAHRTSLSVEQAFRKRHEVSRRSEFK